MSRIRTIKPEFFRHSGLQSLEEAHQRQYPMLVFAGLLTLCDKNGTFLWQPPHIKLDVLPFIPFDMQATLETLVSSGMVIKFTADGREYGHISTFQKHQRVSGTEAKNPARYPHPMEADGRVQVQSGVVDTVASIREPAPQRIRVGKCSHDIASPRARESVIRRDQVEATDLLPQPRIRQRFELEDRI